MEVKLQLRLKLRKKLLCFRCGSANHLANSKTCPAVTKTCNVCKKKGHFSKVCRSTTKNVNYVLNEDETSTDEDVPSMLNMVLSIGEHQNSYDHSDTTTLEGIKFPSCKLHIDGLEVNTWVDTCAGYTIMGNKMFQKLWPERTLFSTDISPASYSGHKIPLCGFVWVNLRYGDITTRGKMYIAEKGQMLLGWPHQARLGIKIDSSKDPPVYCLESSILDYDHLEQEFRSVFINK